MRNINTYTCSNPFCEHVTVTRDINEGTTPMAILCPMCQGTAHSAFYNVDQSLPATHEWYYPIDKVIKGLVEVELKALKKSLKRIPRAYHKRKRQVINGFMDHWKLGGLFLRPIHSLVNIDDEAANSINYNDDIYKDAW